MKQYPSNGTSNRGNGRGRDRDNRNGTGTGIGGRGGRAQNDLRNGQRSVRHYPGSNNNYWSCGLTSNTTVKIMNTKRKATTHQPPSPTKWEKVIPTASIISFIKAEGVGRR